LKAPAAPERNQSKAQWGKIKNPFFLKKFYSFSHIELRESGIGNQEPFSPQTRMFTLLMEGDTFPISGLTKNQELKTQN
jgi:hypothetical protein